MNTKNSQKENTKSDSLTALPNIGKTLAKKLIQAKIESPEELRVISSENAFLRVQCIDQTACFNMLCALEGAIQNIRWHDLSEATKEKLKAFYKLKRITP